MPEPLASPDEVAGARSPLRIVVSQAGQHAALKALVAQCVPVLQNPEAFTAERRNELARRLRRAICPCHSTEQSDMIEPYAEREPQYEPGPWLEEDP